MPRNSNPHDRTSDSSGGQWYRVIAERVQAGPDESVVRAIGMETQLYDGTIRAVIAAYRDWLMREE
jgi:hypothetical protein